MSRASPAGPEMSSANARLRVPRTDRRLRYVVATSGLAVLLVARLVVVPPDALFVLAVLAVIVIAAAFQENELRIAAALAKQKAAVKLLRASNRHLRQADDAKSRFLAAASHDLRQPLSALSLYAGALDGKLAPPYRDVVKNMKGCIGHLNELLVDLLDISKLEAKVMKPMLRDFDVDEVLGKVTASHGPQAAAKGLSLRFRASNAIGRTDPVLFQRIVGNLVSNAIRYSDRGGLLLACRRRGGRMWVEVWDTGIGIPADKTAAIFEEFRQLGDDERTVRGTGLGLAIVAKTAELLGLEISVRSRVGKGSVFGVELPLGGVVSSRLPRWHLQAPLRIALVEDNRDVAAALSYALRQDGHQVLMEASGDAMLERLAEAPDVIVSDYRLAGKDCGLEVIRRVRDRFGAALPAIMITGDTDPALVRRMAGQAIRLAYKPLDIDVLRSLLGQARLGQAA